nr:hemolysin family protein [Pseudoclavibacter chungangensis]
MVAVSGLFAAAETAIGSSSRADLEEYAERGGRASGAIRRIALDPRGHTNALTFARVLFETMAAVLVTLLLLQVFEAEWAVFLVATACMMLASFVLAGASPRSVGRAHPLGVLMATGWLARLVRIVLGPLAEVLVLVGDRVTPGRPRRAGSVTSEEELLSMVDEAAELDVLEDADRELIHAVFDFSGRIVREVMIARTDMITVDEDATAATALDLFLREGLSRAPVVGLDSDHVLGVLYLKDLVRHGVGADLAAGSVTAAEVARPAVFVPESMPTATLLREMQTRSNHFAMVVDEYGGIAGLVTLEDLIEELVGEITDEYDHDDHEVEDLGGGVFRVSSRMPIGELGELFDLELDDEDVDSVGGLLAKTLGKVPDGGDVAVVDGVELRAERVGRRRRVTTVIARRAPGGHEDDEAAAPAGNRIEAP